MHKLWLHTLMDRRPYSEWEEKRDGARDWALERAKKILSTHQPEPLDPKLEVELLKIIQSVEKKQVNYLSLPQVTGLNVIASAAWQSHRTCHCEERSDVAISQDMSLRAQRGNLIIKGGFDESNPYNFFYETAQPVASEAWQSFSFLAMTCEESLFAPRNDNGNWKCTLLYSVTLGQCQLFELIFSLC